MKDIKLHFNSLLKYLEEKCRNEKNMNTMMHSKINITLKRLIRIAAILSLHYIYISNIGIQNAKVEN